jgi:hypothetical protein
MNLLSAHGLLNHGTFLRPLQSQKAAGDILEKLRALECLRGRVAIDYKIVFFLERLFSCLIPHASIFHV